MLLGILLMAWPVTAQDADRVELKVVVGTAGFLDSPNDYHAAIGGAVRVRLSDALSIEPEVLYLRESSVHDDYSFQTAITWEFWRGPGLRPYLVAGAGVLRSRFEFPGALEEHFSSNEFTGGGGVGVRLRLGERLWLSPEFRLGWEPLIRVTVGVGYTFP
jgi:hypothetical protein